MADRLGLERLHPAVVAWAGAALTRSDPRSRERSHGRAAIRGCVRENAECHLSRWTVALSGGADSVALLLLVWALWPERRSALEVAHFNHRLRGRESDADERFCRRVATALKLPFRTARWERPPDAKAPSETEARAARMAFLAKRGNGVPRLPGSPGTPFPGFGSARRAGAVWLGHNADDVAETMLMRLARGSGTGGLAAPRPVQLFADGRCHLRPLLALRREEIRQALRELGIPWREDASNATPAYQRNRVRHEVVSVWEEAAKRDAVAGAARSRALLEEDDLALETLSRQTRAIGRRGELLMGRIDGLPRAVVRRVLHLWLLQLPVRTDLSRQAFEALLGAVEQGRPTRQSLGAGLFAVIKAGRLRLVKG